MLTPDEKIPLISILMGVRYQRENLFLLERAIQSILSQTYPNWEFIICERDSTNAARTRLKQFSEEDPRIYLIDGYGTVGLAEQLNRCMSVAKGNWIARMDDDDVSHPGRFAAQMDYLQKYPQISFVGCVARLERDNDFTGIRWLPARPNVRDFFLVQPFLHPTLLFRREVLEKVGGYSEEPRCLGCEDYDLLLRLYEAGFMGENIQEPLFTYTLPPLHSKKRTMAMRWNEVKTRYVRFKGLGLFPRAFPYVVKPVIVGLLPYCILEQLKKRWQ